MLVYQIDSPWQRRLTHAKAFEARGASHSWRGVGGNDGVVVVAIRATFSLARSVFQDRPSGVE
jgi:hypothetical protein